MPRTPLPPEVEAQMRLYRLGLAALPEGYIAHHAALAEAALKELEERYVIHNQWMYADGWMDGMRVLYAVVENRQTSQLFKVHWHDGNEEFFAYHLVGGSSPLKAMDGSSSTK